DQTSIKTWLKRHSPYFTGDLVRGAGKLKDVDSYVNDAAQEDLLALTRYNFDQAKPLVDQMYLDRSQPVTRAAATWALYRHALETDSAGDIDRYRKELMAMVADGTLPDGSRDMAHDAIIRERDFPGRDEWSFSLYEDETLVEMARFTMLTTLVMHSPPGKYVPKMIELLGSKNLLVRTAAVNNLLVSIGRASQEVDRAIVQALLPWLTNKNWVKTNPERRVLVIQALQKIKLPESVTPLIAALDEKEIVEIPEGSFYGANMAANAANWAANAVNTNSNSWRRAANTNVNVAANSIASGPMKKVTVYPLRHDAVLALASQGDPRAVPALRRIFPLVDIYEKPRVVSAIFHSGGFTVPEQVDAIVEAAKSLPDIYVPDPFSNVNANANAAAYSPELLEVRRAIAMSSSNASANTNANNGGYSKVPSNNPGPSVAFDGEAFKLMVAAPLTNLKNPSDQLVNALALKISELDKREPEAADAVRAFIANWSGRAVNALLLSDLKKGKTSLTAVLKLLTDRAAIREHQRDLIADTASGTPFASGIAACLSDTQGGYEAILKSNNNETKVAMLACARLIRAKLPVKVVAGYLKDTDKRLALAAERYLESEDSAEARAAVLALHPGEAKIMGATTVFESGSTGEFSSVRELFTSVHPYFASDTAAYGDDFLDPIELRLKEEVSGDPKLIGVYGYERNFVYIYQDQSLFSWEDDPGRYRERKLSKEEFDGLKELLRRHDIGNLPPFLGCRAYCEGKQFLIVAKDGGRRVFVKSDRTPKFFSELEGMFKDLRSKPARTRYWLENEVTGLEILFEDDDLKAESVWKNGPDIRLAVSDRKVREKVAREIDAAVARSEEEAEYSDDFTTPFELRNQLIAKHRVDGIKWVGLGADGKTKAAEQPVGVEFLAAADGNDPPATRERWKARAGGVEVRASPDGLFKLAQGRVTKLLDGAFGFPVITPNARWVIAVSDEHGGLVRHNLLTRRTVPVSDERVSLMAPVVFVPSVSKVLLGTPSYEKGPDGFGYEDAALDTDQFYFLDPETGRITLAKGEMRPLVQQSFRPL
ncbi:MAG TPA: hypothetical protein VJ781_10790, partial [Pyrinomonadaceae bacterium]|nr:hypothetical protein [Pyrinomonadaceae bacterium]